MDYKVLTLEVKEQGAIKIAQKFTVMNVIYQTYSEHGACHKMSAQ